MALPLAGTNTLLSQSSSDGVGTVTDNFNKRAIFPFVEAICPRYLIPLRYKLEPIVDLHTDISIGSELLREGRKPYFTYFWHDWYAKAGGLQGELSSHQALFINVDTAQILDHQLVQDLLESVRDHRRLVLEWTECLGSGKQIRNAAVILQDLRNRYGFRLCVDDFGAGIDGVQRVNLVHPDIVKIDGGILHSARNADCGKLLLKNIIHLIKDVGAVSVTEWIETPADLDIALTSGSDFGQGYLWPTSRGTL